MLRVSGSMTNWGCGVRGSDRGRLWLMVNRGRLELVASLPENTYSDNIS